MKPNEPVFQTIATNPNEIADYKFENKGLTVRDYIAIKVMQGLCATEQNPQSFKLIPGVAYALADAMIAESEKVKQP